VGALPPGVAEEVQEALQTLGAGSRITGVASVGGGCINHGATIETDRDRTFFLKWNPSAPAGMFEAEVDGLRALRSALSLRVPEPLATGDATDGPSWLLMEHIPPSAPTAGYDERLGSGLAKLHLCTAQDASFGWGRANWIGSLPQSNEETGSWIDFWSDRRLEPQVSLARSRGYLGRGAQVLDRMMGSVSLALADVDDAPVHLLHGDLWSGNAYPGPGGEPVLIDPAVYRGHGEVDLAMTELFGGFGSKFYEAYAEVAGIPRAYQAFRRDLYQLYYLLVHVNLFGEAYEGRTLAAAGRVVAELGV
jgi:fructosamine-3-kinase